jgi:hypothetical protein
MLIYITCSFSNRILVENQIAHLRRNLGNGNLDTQSFYHSQEINLLLDSPLICRAWLDAIDRNENTKRHGLASKKDGFWHDPVTGKLAEGSMGADPGMFGWAKGLVGTVQRVKNILCT